MELPDIDKDIYARPEIRKMLRPQYWAFISIALGLIGLLIMRSRPQSSLAIGLIAWGGFALLSWLVYVLIGDSRAPFHKPSKKILTREYYYYPSSSKDALVAAVEAKDEKALAAIKRGVAPQLVLVRYSDVEESVVYSQVKESCDNVEQPITDIIA